MLKRGLAAEGFLTAASVNPPTVSGTFADMSNDQLVQAMAGFGGGGGTGESLNTAPLSADTSRQTFLTTPQHA